MQEETEAFTLEQRFSSALSYLCDSSERGFQARLAGRLGVPSGYISGAKSGDRGFSEDNRRAIAAMVSEMKDLPLSYEAFLTLGQLILEGVPGEEALELAKAGDKPFPAILSALDDPLFVSVPKAKSKLSAGGGCFAEEGFSGEYHFRSEWLHSICSPKDAILFDCQGDSMAPFISDGETVLVDRGDTEFQDDKVFAIGVGDTALVKRLRLTLVDTPHA